MSLLSPRLAPLKHAVSRNMHRRLLSLLFPWLFARSRALLQPRWRTSDVRAAALGRKHHHRPPRTGGTSGNRPNERRSAPPRRLAPPPQRALPGGVPASARRFRGAETRWKPPLKMGKVRTLRARVHQAAVRPDGEPAPRPVPRVLEPAPPKASAGGAGAKVRCGARVGPGPGLR